MSDVFISYAHEDQPYVRRLANALEREGFSVWWDHTIPPGKTWNTYIARGIEDAKACIVVWSTRSVASKWVMEEATLGNEAEKLLPVSADGAPPPMGFRSMQAAQLQNWNGDTSNAQWQLLVREVRSLVGAPARPAPARAHEPASPAPPSGAKTPWAILGGIAMLALVAITVLVSSPGDQAAPAEDNVSAQEYLTEVAADPAAAVVDPEVERLRRERDQALEAARNQQAENERLRGAQQSSGSSTLTAHQRVEAALSAHPWLMISGTCGSGPGLHERYRFSDGQFFWERRDGAQTTFSNYHGPSPYAFNTSTRARIGTENSDLWIELRGRQAVTHQGGVGECVFDPA